MSVVKRSCTHEVHGSFDAQIARLEAAGFPCSVVSAAVEAVLKRLKAENSNQETIKEGGNKKREVVPYVHKTSHNLKKAVKRFGVQIAFSAPLKLGGMCARIGKSSVVTKGCGKKHSHSYIDCCVGVVYQIPLTCGKVYVGQTGRCINVRLREHELSIQNSASGHLPTHCSKCTCKPCKPLLKEVKILCRCRDSRAREIREAYHIRKSGLGCISETSIWLHNSEMKFIDDRS